MLYKKGDIVKILDHYDLDYVVIDRMLNVCSCYYYVYGIKDNHIDYDNKLIVHINELYKEEN